MSQGQNTGNGNGGPGNGNSGGNGGNLHIFVNRRKFEEGDGVRPQMTGAQIAALVEVPPENAVVRLDNGPDQREIPVTETVQIRNGMHFLVTRRLVEGGHE